MAAPLKVMVVEDHHMLREATVAALVNAGFLADGVMSAEELDELRSPVPPDIYVLDLNLPGEDGLSLAQRLRAAQPACGIVMLTARTLTQDRVSGYRSGADIYLSKPTEPEELIAAVESLSARLQRSVPASPVHSGETQQTHLYLASRILEGRQGRETLSERETSVLAALIRVRSRRLENWQLIEIMGEDPLTYQKASLEVAMTRLRQKLARVGGSAGGLVALRGVGYQLRDPIVLA